MSDPELTPIIPEYTQSLEIFGKQETVQVARIKRLQRGHSSETVGEGPVHRVKFSSQNPDLNGLVCIEKQIYPKYQNRKILSPQAQLEKYEAIKAQGGIVPEWMCVSSDGLSLYSQDLSNNGTIYVLDTNMLFLYPEFILPEQPWIMESRERILEQVAHNLVVAAKADMIASADSMFFVKDPDKIVYMADFGAGVEKRTEFDPQLDKNRLLAINLRRVGRLMDVLDKDDAEFAQYAQELFLRQ